MNKMILLVTLISLLLMGCKSDDLARKQQHTIDSLSASIGKRDEKIEELNKTLKMEQAYDSLDRKKMATAGKKVQDSLKWLKGKRTDDNLKKALLKENVRLCCTLNTSENFYRDAIAIYDSLEDSYYENFVFPQTIKALFLYSNSEFLRLLKSEQQDEDRYDPSFLTRVKFVKGEEVKLHNAATSNNHPRGSAQFIFEYLGDCAGNSYGWSWGTEIFLDIVTSPKLLNRTVDLVADKVFYLLEEHWTTEEEKKSITEALRYVLETTKEVDYNAKIDTTMYSSFLNEEYEKQWNGVQKFFYRAERRYPGSTQRIRENIEHYLENKRSLKGSH